MHRYATLLIASLASLSAGAVDVVAPRPDPRPVALVAGLADGRLKRELAACTGDPVRRASFSLGHRGAPLHYPEHTRESYVAAAAMGAGVIECDVTFTRDKQLVCRHAQDDLHTTTDILLTPLAARCKEPFRPAQFDAEGALLAPAAALCRTSDITLAEFRTLRGKRTEDMIFAGSAQRARLGMASASLTLDNADGWLPVEFSEVTITRRAFRSGENEYLLNGTRVRYREISDLLGAAGLAASNYVVIGQGLVDVSLKDRRHRPLEFRQFDRTFCLRGRLAEDQRGCKQRPQQQTALPFRLSPSHHPPPGDVASPCLPIPTSPHRCVTA